MGLATTLRTLKPHHAAIRRVPPSAMVARLERHKDALPPRLNVG